MKFNSFKTFVFLIYALLKLNIISGQTFLLKNSLQTYDVKNPLEEFSENIRTVQNLETTTNDLDISKVLDDIRSININTLISTLLNVLSNSANSNCLQDLLYTVEKLKDTKLQDLVNNSWALQMIDSYGKPESGYLSGNTKWVGDFDECRSVYAPKQKDGNAGGFHGKYCSVEVTLYIFPVTIGICLPETCDSSDFIRNGKNVLNSVPAIDKLKSIITVKSLTCQPNTRQLSNAAIATIFLIAIFVFLAFLGSLTTVIKHVTTVEPRKNSCQKINNEEAATGGWDKENFDTDGQLQFSEGSITKPNALSNDTSEPMSNKNLTEKSTPPISQLPPRSSAIRDRFSLFTSSSTNASARITVFIEKVEPFLNCFCAFTNGSKLLNTDATEGQLLCLHGIRFLSMSWVIVCHIYSASQSSIRNFKGAVDQIDNVPFQVIFNGWYAVDSFFVLSGFLLSYLYFQETAKRKDKAVSLSRLRNLISSLMRWIYFYVHRYLRLTPVYMIVLAFFATVNTHLGTGPFRINHDIDPVCQKYWWWNLLYINNFKDSIEQCMSWSWYLANDMQFFVFSPLFLITLWRWPKIGFSFLAVALCGSSIANFVITYHYELMAGGLGDVTFITTDATFAAKFGSYFDKIYTKPYTRAGPYLVGIALGYIAYKTRTTNYKLKNMYLWIGWFIATPVGLACVYGLYHKVPAVLAASFYNTLTRTCYALSLSWVIFVCLCGQGGPVDRILSYKLFIPLSRLTYCAYLIHPIIVGYYVTTMRTTFVFTHSTMIILFLGLIIVTYAVSMLMSLIFESPLIRLEKFVRSKFQF